MGDPEDYSIAREGVWGREGLAIAVCRRAGGFFFSLFFALGRSWSGLGSSWVVLGRSLIGLGRS